MGLARASQPFFSTEIKTTNSSYNVNVEDESGALPKTWSSREEWSDYHLPGYSDYPLEPPVFSHPAGFYPEPFELHIHHDDPDVTLYYTLDGSRPDTTSLRADSAIFITDRTALENRFSIIPTNAITEGSRRWIPPEINVPKATVVQVKVYRSGSVPLYKTRSFFVFNDQPYFSLPVLSINTDSLNLFDPETGIYVAGNLHDGDHSTGNYQERGIEWERLAHFEFFEDDGELAFSQHIGLRIHGGWSRRFPQKSLRLYSRSDYGESRFNYRIFPESNDDNYNRLILRNSGTDFGFTMFRDAAAQSLVRHFNVDTQAYRPVVVFLNGEYWGIHNIRERYDKHYLQRVYGANPDQLDLLTGRHDVKEGSNDHYLETLSLAIHHDLSCDSLFSELETRIDTDNFLDYYSAQIYLGNDDWPQNNIDFWRYRTPYNPDAPVGLDGRWRWLLFDTDYSLGWNMTADDGPDFDMIEWVTAEINERNDSDWPNLLLRNMLDNESFHNRFINRILDHLNTAFTAERVTGIADSLQRTIEPEMPLHIQRWPNHVSMEYWNQLTGQIQLFAMERPQYVRAHLSAHFDAGDEAVIEIDVNDASKGSVTVNSTIITPCTPGVPEPTYPWSGTYLSQNAITLTAKAEDGYRFSHWSVEPAISGSAPSERALSGPVSSERTISEGVISGPAPTERALSGSTLSGSAISEPTDTLSHKLTLFPTDRNRYTAIFLKATEPVIRPEVIHYWLFTGNLPNNTPLDSIPASHSVNSHGMLVYKPAIVPYPPADPSMTDGIMDRVNDPTEVNYLPQYHYNLPLEDSDMRGIRTRNPSLIADRESRLVLHVPSSGHEKLGMDLALKRTANGQRSVLIEYSPDGGTTWSSENLEQSEIMLYETWIPVSISFEEVEPANDNPLFAIRFRYGGEDSIRKGSDGNVRFNNISVSGYAMEQDDQTKTEGPELLAPDSNATGVPMPAAFSWQDHDHATRYEIEISTSPGFDELWADRNLQEPSYLADMLADTTTYFWRVRAVRDSLKSSWSKVRSFTTELRKPASPTWIAENYQIIFEHENRLEWSYTKRAETYHLQFTDTIDFSRLILEKSELEQTEFEVEKEFRAGNIYYSRVRAVNERGYSGWSDTLSILVPESPGSTNPDIPEVLTLRQNYPNPFNHATRIRFALPESARVRLSVYNVLGQQVARLVDENRSKGWHEVVFDARGLSSGLYLYRLETDRHGITKNMLLLK